MKKIAVVGVYGEGEDFTTGQAVKCYAVINWLRKKYGDDNVCVVNTYKWKNNPFRLFCNLIVASLKSSNIVIMPAQHGIKVFAPLVYGINKLFHRGIQYIVIGGWLAEMLKDKPWLRECISSYDGVFVEAVSLKEKLEELGLNNVYYMPNSREYTPVIRETDFTRSTVKVCTYSRVVREKGISDAVEICKAANEMMGRLGVRLDIYGKIDSSFSNEFQQILNEEPDVVQYCGCKNADESIQTLVEYFALLFPTYYEGEGFAGTVLDGFAAQTPVIANDWKYNLEIIQNGVNGFIYPYRDVKAAAKILVDLIHNQEVYRHIQNNCQVSAKKYSMDNVMNEFVQTLKL